MLKLFSNFFKLIFEYNLSFRFLYKCDVVLLDDNFSKLKLQNKILFEIKKNEIFFNTLVKSILIYIFERKYDIKYYYYNSLLKKLNPKVVIGHSENHKIINCKKSYSKVKTITYQMLGYSKSYFLYKENLARLKQVYESSDFFFVYSNKQKTFLKNIGFKNPKKIFVTGSIRSNERGMKKNIIKYDILFISQFRKKGILWDYIKNGKIYKNERFINSFKKKKKFIVKTIQSYCQKFNKKFQIALVSSREEKNFNKNNEIKYYKKILDKFYPEDRNGWSLGEISKLIVVQSSNIGLELEAVGHKVLYLPLDLKDLSLNKMIGLIDFPESGAINICRQANKTKIFKKINYLLNPKLNTYHRKNKIFYDKGNRILKKNVNNLTK